mgnify:CR=1 FL=1
MSTNLTKEQEQKIKEHYDNPKNNKALKNYNARGVGRNPDNWGQVDLYLLVDENMVLSDLGYEYKGCPTISFTASIFTEELKGVLLEDAKYTAQIELDEMDVKENCDDCIKMIFVSFLCAYDNYFQRLKGSPKEDYTFKMIDTIVPYTQQSCS